MAEAFRHESLFLRIFARRVSIDCRDGAAAKILAANYESFGAPPCCAPDLAYTVSAAPDGCGFSLARRFTTPLIASDDGEFLFLFEKDLTIELQKLRPDLYFLHAAALGHGRRVVMLVGASGSGKSTTAWALLHSGFSYFSDEMAPVDLDGMRVQPYPHALCFKAKPPLPYILPKEQFVTSTTVHVPAGRVGKTASEPGHAEAIFFLEAPVCARAPEIRRLSRAEAAARLYVNALNPLAHPKDGLTAAATIAANVTSFSLTAGELGRTCAAIAETLRQLGWQTGDGNSAPANRAP